MAGGGEAGPVRAIIAPPKMSTDDRRTMRTGLPPLLATEIDGLVGAVLPVGDGTRIRVERLLGRGAVGVTFAATRIAPSGARPIALKVLRPSLLRAALSLGFPPPLAHDRAALTRLARGSPLPLARLIRLLDDGIFPAGSTPALEVDTPWLAAELLDAPSLFTRVRAAMAEQGVPLGAAATVAILADAARALDDLHRAGIVHRAVHPHQLLVPDGPPRGRLGDAAVSRAEGTPPNFGLHAAQDEATIAPYLAPEQREQEWRGAVAIDVFAYARLVRFALTGRAPTRPLADDLAEASTLHPDLARTTRLELLHDTLAVGEHEDPARRPPSVGALWALVHAALVEGGRHSWAVSSRRPTTASSAPPVAAVARSAGVADEPRRPGEPAPWVWSLRHRPSPRLELGVAALDADGGGVALVDGGVSAFDGGRFAPLGASLPNASLRGVRALGGSRFALFGSGGLVAIVDALGARTATAGAPLDVLAAAEDGPRLLMVGRSAVGIVLYVLEDSAWRAPLPIDGASDVCGLVRLDGHGWVLAGATLTGAGFLAAYDDRAHVVRAQPPIGRVSLRALASDGAGLAVAVGPHGTAISISRFAESPTRLRATLDAVETPRHLTAALVDSSGRAWAASDGLVLQRRATEAEARWSVVWQDADLPIPTRALALVGRSLLVLLADGTVIEGRALG
jgi:serine/threonine protein kinase